MNLLYNYILAPKPFCLHINATEAFCGGKLYGESVPSRANVGIYWQVETLVKGLCNEANVGNDKHKFCEGMMWGKGKEDEGDE